MGGAQPLAVTMNGGVAICVDCDPSRISRRIEHGYLDVRADGIDDAIRRADRGPRRRQPLSIGLLGNAAEVVPELLAMNAPIDIVTDQTSAHDPLSYLPRGVAFEDMAALRAEDPDGFTRRARQSMAEHVEAMVGFAGPGRGGVRLRQLHPRRGRAGRVRAGLRLPRLRARLHPAAVLRGPRPVPVGRAVR